MRKNLSFALAKLSRWSHMDILIYLLNAFNSSEIHFSVQFVFF